MSPAARRLFRGHRSPASRRSRLLRPSGARDAATRRPARPPLWRRGVLYWHYWFGGGDRCSIVPFAEVLTSGEPGLPVRARLGESAWTGTWHGAPDRVLDRADATLAPRMTWRTSRASCRRSAMSAISASTAGRSSCLPAGGAARCWGIRRPVAGHGAPGGARGLYLVAEISDLMAAAPATAAPKPTDSTPACTCGFPPEITRWTTLRMRARRKVFGGPEVWPYEDSIVDNYPPGSASSHACTRTGTTPRVPGAMALPSLARSPDGFERNVREAVAQLADRPLEDDSAGSSRWNEWAEGQHAFEPDLRDRLPARPHALGRVGPPNSWLIAVAPVGPTTSGSVPVAEGAVGEGPSPPSQDERRRWRERAGSRLAKQAK